MRIDLRPVPLKQATVRYPISNGELIRSSVLIDRPADLLNTFRRHHQRYASDENHDLMHLTISLAPGQQLSKRKWQKALKFVLDRLGAPLHQLWYFAFRHLNKKLDHIHAMFSPFTINGRRLSPKIPADRYKVQNEAARRVGLPCPFPDGPDAPILLQAPISRGKSNGDDNNSRAVQRIGSAINQIIHHHRPTTWDSFCKQCFEEGVQVERRDRTGCPTGVAYSTDITENTRISRMTRAVRVKGRDVGRQFRFLGLMRRLSLVRTLQEREHALALSQLTAAAEPRHINQLKKWIQDNERTRAHAAVDPIGHAGRFGKPAPHNRGAGDSGASIGSRGGRTRTGSGSGDTIDRAAIPVFKQHSGAANPDGSNAERHSDAAFGHKQALGKDGKDARGGRSKTDGPYASRGRNRGKPGKSREQSGPDRDVTGTNGEPTVSLIGLIGVIAQPRPSAPNGLRVKRRQNNELTLIDENDRIRVVLCSGHLNPITQEDNALAWSLADDLGQQWIVSEQSEPEIEPDTPSPFD